MEELEMDFHTLSGKESGIRSDPDVRNYIRELIYTYATFYLVTCLIFVFSW